LTHASSHPSSDVPDAVNAMPVAAPSRHLCHAFYSLPTQTLLAVAGAVAWWGSQLQQTQPRGVRCSRAGHTLLQGQCCVLTRRLWAAGDPLLCCQRVVHVSDCMDGAGMFDASERQWQLLVRPALLGVSLTASHPHCLMVWRRKGERWQAASCWACCSASCRPRAACVCVSAAVHYLVSRCMGMWRACL